MKKIFTLFVLCSSFHLSFSQRFINGIGACVFSTSGSGFGSFVTGGITYSPRVNLTESEQATISIGIPMSIGIGYSSNGSGVTSASAVINMPLVVNYNFGCGSTRQNSDRFGFFAGGGFGYHAAAYASEDSYGNEGTTEIKAFGPVVNTGIRFGLGHRSHNLEFKLSYMKGLDVTKADIFGIAVLFNF
jgi:hypothetical protein